MSKDYKCISTSKYYEYIYIPKYNEINKQIYNGNTALIVSCYFLSINITRLLLSHPSINVNTGNILGQTALYYANKACYTKLINLLEQHNAK